MQLLTDLYKINSPSGKEKSIRKFIISKLPTNCTYVVDIAGNLLIEKGTGLRPCLCAHMDEVHNITGRKILANDEIIIGYKNGLQCGIGADDKNGIYIALLALNNFANIKIAFFVEEETGGRGSSFVDMSFFSDVTYLLQFDRKNGGDLITTISGDQICSDKFIDAIRPIYTRFGYRETSGLFTDVYNLYNRGVNLSALNISCGYYGAHTDSEHTNVKQLKNATYFCFDILRTIKKQYKHKKSNFKVLGSSKYWEKSYNQQADAYRDEIPYNWRKYYYNDVPCDTCELLDCTKCKLIQ